MALKNSAGACEHAQRSKPTNAVSSPKYLFVYGTLRRKRTPREMTPVMQKLEWVGKGSVLGRIYDLGNYPGAVFDQRSSQQIQGEIYKLPLDGKVLEKLDAYEEFLPSRPDDSLFIRVVIPVQVKKGRRLNCWAYRFNPKKLKQPASRTTTLRKTRSSRPQV